MAEPVFYELQIKAFLIEIILILKWRGVCVAGAIRKVEGGEWGEDLSLWKDTSFSEE